MGRRAVRRKPPKPWPAWRVNAEVAATVTRVLSARRVQLIIDGQRIIADTCLELQAGSRLQLKMIQTDPRPVLKILASARPPGVGGDARAAAPPRLPAILLPACPVCWQPSTGCRPGPTGGGEGLARLTGLITTLALKSAAPDAALLGRLLLNAGMVWEAKLTEALTRKPALAPEGLRQMATGDLKAAALGAAAGGGRRPPRPGVPSNASWKALKTLQLLNRHAARPERSFNPPTASSLGRRPCSLANCC